MSVHLPRAIGSGSQRRQLSDQVGYRIWPRQICRCACGLSRSCAVCCCRPAARVNLDGPALCEVAEERWVEKEEERQLAHDEDRKSSHAEADAEPPTRTARPRERADAMRREPERTADRPANERAQPRCCLSAAQRRSNVRPRRRTLQRSTACCSAAHHVATDRSMVIPAVPFLVLPPPAPVAQRN